MPDHTLPGLSVQYHTLPGHSVSYHTLPGRWVGAATATTASAWDAASLEVTAFAPATAFDVLSAWPSASVEVTAFAPGTTTGVVSAWPAASLEVTGNVVTTVTSNASTWPVASTEVTAFAPTTVFTADTSIYVYPNSLWVNGTTAQVPYWLGLMEEVDSTDLFYDGEAAAFFANGAGFPSTDPLNFVQGASTIRSHNTENPGVDYTDVVFVANNFVQGSTVSTEYTNHRDRMDALIDHWNDTLGQTPVYWIQEGVVEGTMLTSPIGSATRDEFDDMLDTLRSGSYPDWFDTLLGAVQTLQPARDIRLFKASSYFQNVVQGTALIDLDPDDFFVDTDPHGTDTHYAIKAMIFFAYTEGYVPTSSSWTTGLNATFISNYTAIAARIEDLVLGNAVTPQALSSNDWSVATSSTANGLDFAITAIPETVTDIDYSTDDGSTWASLGQTTTGTYTVTTASGGGALAASTAYTTRLRLVNATGDGQGTRSKAGTSAAAGDVASSWDMASIAITAYAPSTGSSIASTWPLAAVEITALAPSTGSSIASSWPAASVEVTANAPTTSVTIASTWPLATTSVTGFAPTTVAGGSATWTAWRTAGTVAIDGANAGGEWDPAPSVSVLATADNSNANLFIGSSTAEYAEGVFATNFGFTTSHIPSSSTINGIEVRFVDSQSDIAGRPWYYTNVFITVDGSTNDGTAKSPTSDTVTSATGDTITIPSTGGDTDAWGTAITDSEVRGTNFGIHFSCGATADTPVLAATDQLEIRVNYT